MVDEWTQYQELWTQALDTSADTARGASGAFHAEFAPGKYNKFNKTRRWMDGVTELSRR